VLKLNLFIIDCITCIELSIFVIYDETGKGSDSLFLFMFSDAIVFYFLNLATSMFHKFIGSFSVLCVCFFRFHSLFILGLLHQVPSTWYHSGPPRV